MSSRSEEKLIAHVKETLQGQKGLEGAEIFVSVKDKVVTLKGVVDTAKEQKKAFELAQGVSGVDSVVNELKVMSKTRSDAEKADRKKMAADSSKEKKPQEKKPEAKKPQEKKLQEKKPQAKSSSTTRSGSKSSGKPSSSGQGSMPRSQGLSMKERS